MHIAFMTSADDSILPEEEIADCFAAKQSAPPPSPVLLSVMQDMAALTQGGEVAGPVVRGIVIAVRRGQEHARRSHRSEDLRSTGRVSLN